MSRSLRLAFALVIGTLAAWGTLAITEPPGPGLDPDSMSYTIAARSLAQHGALVDERREWWSADSTKPFAHWPPGYPAVLAAPTALGIDTIQAARAVNAIAAFATLTMLVWLVSASADGAWGAAAGLAVLVTPAVVAVHENVLSEPLFLALMVATLAAMVRQRERPLVAGLWAAAASLVRYAGVALIAAAGMWALRRGTTWRDRVRGALMAVAPGTIAQAAWVLRSVHAGGSRAIRAMSVYGQVADIAAETWDTLGNWLAPSLEGAVRDVATAAMLAALAALLVLGARRARGMRDRDAGPVALLGASGVIAACYFAVVLAARLFADPDIPLDDRILLPVIVLGDVAVVIAARVWWRVAGRITRASMALVGSAWVVGAALGSVASAQYALETGNDLADVCWSGSPLVAWVRAHAGGRSLVSNVPEALYFDAGRFAHEPPHHFAPDTLRAFADTAARRRALIIAFDRRCAPVDVVDTTLAGIPAREVTRAPGGVVYEVATPP